MRGDLGCAGMQNPTGVVGFLEGYCRSLGNRSSGVLGTMAGIGSKRIAGPTCRDWLKPGLARVLLPPSEPNIRRRTPRRFCRQRQW